jgi:hypothetical protein
MRRGHVPANSRTWRHLGTRTSRRWRTCSGCAGATRNSCPAEREGAIVIRILVTSASGANGNGYGAILGFGPEGEFTGPFSSDPRIADPRGLSLDPSGALVYLNSGEDHVLALDLHGHVVRDSGRVLGLDPGGAEFGPDGRYYFTARRPRLVTDPELSPLDLKLAPNGNIVVASEWPFGVPDAVPTIREYDPLTGQLVRVFVPERSVGFRRPRGLRFGPDGRLYCAGEDHVVAFDFSTANFAGAVVRLERLNGQALVLVP